MFEIKNKELVFVAGKGLGILSGIFVSGTDAMRGVGMTPSVLVETPCIVSVRDHPY